jgi:adenylate kinase family enzyme
MTLPHQPNLVPHNHPLGRRVAVFGAGGKTTLAGAIARKRGLAFIELDQIQHMQGWVRRPDHEIRQIVTNRMDSSPRGWVTDHNFEFILERADTLIVLELPFRTIFWRRLKRSIKRAWTKELVCGGNRETFRQHLASRDSAILEMWQKRKRYSRIMETTAPHIPPGVSTYHITTPCQLEEFYKTQGLSRNPSLTTTSP